MEWSDFKRRYGLVTFLSCMAAVMVVIKITYKPIYEPYQNQAAVPTLTPVPSPTSAVEEETVDVNYPLLELLPYTGKGFVADRYVAPMVLAVKIKGLDRVLAAKEIMEWMQNSGVDPASHDIQWE